MPKQCPQVRELITVLIDVRHTAPQTRLQLLRVVPEQQHHHAPRQARERGPCVVADLGTQRLSGDDGEAGAGLDGEACEGESYAGEDVDDDLLVDGGDAASAFGAGAEDEVAADETAEEAIVRTYVERVVCQKLCVLIFLDLQVLANLLCLVSGRSVS